ncbi:MAG: presenilin family intramembrane aspartyl protease [Candidatus Marsarchaeota archaeon]|nr:presenilin family intramembrane aspartyl protease [Candidatus Marsarchaeota archaeon]
MQLGGLLLAFYLISPSEVFVSQTGGGAGSADVLIYFAYLIVAALVMVVLFRKFRGQFLFKGIEAIVIISSSFYLFLIILSSFLPQYHSYVFAASFVGAIALVAAKNKWPRLRNFTAIVASVGVGLVLGIYFSFFASFVFMALVAAYDYVAVFITRHMLTLGRESVNRNLAFMVGTYDVEVVPRSYLKGKEAAAMQKELAGVKGAALKNLMKGGGIPIPSFSALGAGDLAIPLMLAVSAYTTYFSYFFSAILVASSCFGLVFSMYVSKRYRMALPAIPPLFSFASIGFGLYTLLTSPAQVSLYALLFAEGVVVLLIMIITAINQNRNGTGGRIAPRRPTSYRS